MYFVLKPRNCVFKTRNCAFKTRNFALKMMNFASHHYEMVLQDLTMCIQRFPNARICGDDWDYPPVQRAAVDAGATAGLTIHAEGGKCWAYNRGELTPQGLARCEKL